MTKEEKIEFLKSRGWSSKLYGRWWTKNLEDKGIGIDEAIALEEVPAEPETIARAIPETPPMPESVKKNLEENRPESPYPHVGAGYASEMLRAIQVADEEMSKNVSAVPKTYTDLTAYEERLRAF